MKTIPLKNGKTLIVDDDNYDEAIKYNWFLAKNQDGSFKVAASINGKDVSYKSHILGQNAPQITIHKNGNSLDLRKKNLTLFENRGDFLEFLRSKRMRYLGDGYVFSVVKSKSVQGRIPRNARHSKYIGVFPNINRTRWLSAIKHNYQNTSIGTFHTEIEAALAYDLTAIEIYGEDAKRNFPSLSVDELRAQVEEIRKKNDEIFHDVLTRRHQGKRFNNITKTSQYIGVSLKKGRVVKCWRANIFYKNKQYALGTYATEEEAARAYDKKAIEFYGETARLNFPNNPTQ